jgi:hypothetical protein
LTTGENFSEYVDRGLIAGEEGMKLSSVLKIGARLLQMVKAVDSRGIAQGWDGTRLSSIKVGFFGVARFFIDFKTLKL